MQGEVNEECGVFGIFAPAPSNVAKYVYYGLYALQHRGQESCGIVVNDDGIFCSHKDLGLVNEVFTKDVMARLPQGKIAVGHVRYGTTGATNRNNCQPIEVNHRKGRIAIAHNGNLSNAYNLREQLEMTGAIFHTTCDTEIIAYLITKERLTAPSTEMALSKVFDKIEGAYSLVLMTPTKLIAARDPQGFRPLCYGITPSNAYIVASESCALKAVGAKYVRDIEAGEIVVFDDEGVHSNRTHCGKNKKLSRCIFEYIYFARPDSVIDGVSVHKSREKAGQLLAKAHPVEADVVIGVPDSGLDAALGYSKQSGIPYGIGFIKNKYIGRTFITPGQDDRANLVNIKLNPISDTVDGKRVVLIDDSIVRGTTSRRIVTQLRMAGAKEIHMRISAPPFLYPCYYGTDIDSRENLIAVNHSVDEICKMIGADSLGYLPFEDLSRLIDSDDFCAACFCGDYPTKVYEGKKDRFERKLSEKEDD